MKTGIRVLVAVAAVLVMAVGAWGVAAAQRNGALAGSLPGVRDLASSVLHWSSRGPVAEDAGDDHGGTQQEPTQSSSVEDHVGQQADDGDVVSAATPEPGDDNGGASEPTQAPELQHETSGTVTAVTATAVTIDGQVYQLAAGAEGLANVTVGAVVKVEFVTNADGTVSVREIKLADLQNQSGDTSQSTDDSSVQHESGSGSGSGGGHHGGGDDGSGG